VVDSDTNKTLAEYELTVNNEPFARWKADKLFRQEHPTVDANWSVDSMVLE
jgi:hypothetical protein